MVQAAGAPDGLRISPPRIVVHGLVALVALALVVLLLQVPFARRAHALPVTVTPSASPNDGAVPCIFVDVYSQSPPAEVEVCMPVTLTP